MRDPSATASRIVHAEPLYGAQPPHLDPGLEAVGIQTALLIGGRVEHLVGGLGLGLGLGIRLRLRPRLELGLRLRLGLRLGLGSGSGLSLGLGLGLDCADITRHVLAFLAGVRSQWTLRQHTGFATARSQGPIGSLGHKVGDAL